MDKINIRVLRHAAFYSPLLYAIKAGFFKAEGLEIDYQIANPTKTIAASLDDGSVQVAQWAVAASFPELERGETPQIVHFAQINQRDGFFIAAKEQTTPFTWQDLLGKKILVDHLFQPLAMFKYALHKAGVDVQQLEIIDAGDVLAMEQAFRAGTADYIHQQGPAPQQLEYENKAVIVAAVGDLIGEVAFSSLCATRTWLQTEQAAAFMQGYQKACAALVVSSAKHIAALEGDFFPQIAPCVLEKTIAAYQALGCWSANPRISEQSYNTLLDVFLHNRMITQRHPYHAAIVEFAA